MRSGSAIVVVVFLLLGSLIAAPSASANPGALIRAAEQLRVARSTELLELLRDPQVRTLVELHRTGRLPASLARDAELIRVLRSPEIERALIRSPRATSGTSTALDCLSPALIDPAAALDSSLAKAIDVAAREAASSDGLAERILRGTEVGPETDAAVRALVVRFRTLRGLRLTPEQTEGLFAPGVTGASEPVLEALGRHLIRPNGSFDKIGAANVEHIRGVFNGVLHEARAAAGRPLTQSELDQLLVRTVLTDAWGKGPMSFEGVTMAPVRINGELTTDAQTFLKAFTDAGEPDFLGFTWIHGLPPFSRIEAVVNDLVRGGVLDARSAREFSQSVYVDVLGHHPIGFIATRFHKTGVMPAFDVMAAQGQIPREAVEPLTNLYRARMHFHGELGARAAIDEASLSGRGFTAAELADWQRRAVEVRKAIEALPETTRWQHVMDDVMQFTDADTTMKWLGIGTLGKDTPTMGDAIEGAFVNAANGYNWEAAMIEATLPTETRFAEVARPVASRLGVTVDETRGFQLAGDAASLREHASLVIEQPEARAFLLQDPGMADALRNAGVRTADDLSGWWRVDPVDIANGFRRMPYDPAVARRVAGP